MGWVRQTVLMSSLPHIWAVAGETDAGTAHQHEVRSGRHPRERMTPFLGGVGRLRKAPRRRRPCSFEG